MLFKLEIWANILRGAVLTAYRGNILHFYKFTFLHHKNLTLRLHKLKVKFVKIRTVLS